MKTDKVLHFCVGIIIMALAFIVGTLVGAPGTLVASAGMLLSMGAAGAKEWWDGQGHGNVDAADFWVTVAGAAFAGLIITLLT